MESVDGRPQASIASAT